jgi:hypothetical protein
MLRNLGCRTDAKESVEEEDSAELDDDADGERRALLWSRFALVTKFGDCERPLR